MSGRVWSLVVIAFGLAAVAVSTHGLVHFVMFVAAIVVGARAIATYLEITGGQRSPDEDEVEP